MIVQSYGLHDTPQLEFYNSLSTSLHIRLPFSLSAGSNPSLDHTTFCRLWLLPNQWILRTFIPSYISILTAHHWTSPVTPGFQLYSILGLASRFLLSFRKKTKKNKKKIFIGSSTTLTRIPPYWTPYTSVPSSLPPRTLHSPYFTTLHADKLHLSPRHNPSPQ